MEMDEFILRGAEFVIALSAVAGIFYKIFNHATKKIIDSSLQDVRSSLETISSEVSYNSGHSLKDKVRDVDLRLSSMSGKVDVIMEVVKHGDS
jgi:uncharacterized protein YoxC